MNATEKDNVFYCDCGFSWRRGMSGSHNCEDGLRAKLTDMAVQLANAESKCRELAAVVAENAALKNPDNWLSQSDYGYEAAEVATQNGATEDESLRAGMVAIINRIETPATDAHLAEVRPVQFLKVTYSCLNKSFLTHPTLSLFARNAVTAMNPGTVILLTDCCGLATFNVTTEVLSTVCISRQQTTQRKAV
ncbi:hypothetical protein ACLH09_23050 [Citrobacter braakii]|uniref:hypothetical protein n=1 Tax=Citrobacter braakii TaxID=57706 RepID=UPI003983E2E1